MECAASQNARQGEEVSQAGPYSLQLVVCGLLDILKSIRTLVSGEMRRGHLNGATTTHQIKLL